MKAHQDAVTPNCKLKIAKGMNMGLLSVLDNDFLQWPTLHCQFSFCSLHSKNFLYVFSIHQASKTCRNSANGIVILPVIVFLEVLSSLAPWAWTWSRDYNWDHKRRRDCWHCSCDSGWFRYYWCYRGPDSCVASISQEESWISSQCGIDGASRLRRFSASHHFSHRSTNPSPSNILTTSDILGRSLGDVCEHKSATCTMYKETNGSPQGHNPSSGITMEASRCHKAEIKEGGESWTDVPGQSPQAPSCYNHFWGQHPPASLVSSLLDTSSPEYFSNYLSVQEYYYLA